MAKDKKGARARIGRAVQGAAPQIAGALGGPLAGAAVAALSKAVFGEEGASETAIEAALKDATAAQIVAIQRAEAEFQIALAKAGVDAARIAADDRAGARARHQAMADATPAALGGLIILGFFVVLGAMVARRLPAGAENEFAIMLGALATMAAAVVNYYFGSSAGSKEKTQLIAFGKAKESE